MHKNKVDNYSSIIFECFSEDKDLIDIYHINSGTSLNECAERTINDLKLADKSLEFYYVTENEKPIGYFASEHVNGVNGLSTIFVRPQFRNKESLSKFWNLINSHFNNQMFVTFIYSKNTRASNFFKKNNGKKIEVNFQGNSVDMFVFNKKDELCQ